MTLVKKGKTKDVYRNDDGLITLQFKDDVTGTNGTFDPGANHVGLTLSGIGKENLKLSTYLFTMLNDLGVATHFVDCDLDTAQMRVQPATVFGEGIEVICRFIATGSFIRRYGAYIDDGDTLNAYVEVTLKDDDRNDPLITSDGLVALGILSCEEYQILTSLTKQISTYIQKELSNYNLILLDIKLEFGRHEETGEIMLIDELSSGNMRVSKDGAVLAPFELIDTILNHS